MERREFIRKSCTACLSVTMLSSLISSCNAIKYISGKLGKHGLTVSTEDFKVKQKGGTAYSSFIVIRNEALKYPVCLFRHNDEQYTAVWMKCTHQGAELQASGDVLVCSAHGSEFTNRGVVRNGPANTNLKTFPVVVTRTEIFIDMRKQS